MIEWFEGEIVRFIYRDERGYQLGAYEDYLRDHAGKLPEGARAFALADWHYDISHHQCPHDSWLEKLTIKENAWGQRQQNSTVEIESLFYGAYHDGYFSLIYRNVLSYSLQFEARSPASTRRAHGDWMVDEVTVTDSNAVRHEIEFEQATLIVTCADLEYRWMPQMSRASH